MAPVLHTELVSAAIPLEVSAAALPLGPAVEPDIVLAAEAVQPDIPEELASVAFAAAFASAAASAGPSFSLPDILQDLEEAVLSSAFDILLLVGIAEPESELEHSVAFHLVVLPASPAS